METETPTNIVALCPPCAYCGKENATMRCSLCKETNYCNRECQKKDWPQHKEICSGIKRPRYEDFEVIKQIGTGNFSEIYLVEEKRTKKQYALKVVNKVKVQKLHKENDCLMEKYVLNKINAAQIPGVVTLHETFKDDFQLYYLMDWVSGGELWEICKVFGMSENRARYYFAKVVKAISAIHDMGIIHRDIKSENIMIDTEDNIILVDFGTAKDLIEPMPEVQSVRPNKREFKNFVGTPQFMPPECIHNRFTNYKSDVWSLGCLLFYMLTGNAPFEEKSDYLIFTKVLANDLQLPDFLSEEAAELIKACLNLEYDERPSIEELKAFAFFNGVDWECPQKLPDSLQEQAYITIKEDFLARYTTIEGIDEEFEEKIYPRFPDSSRIKHLHAKILHHIKPPEDPSQQPVDEEEGPE